MLELEPGFLRVTFPLPFGIDHVHCYFVRSSTGGWTIVDTGLGSRDPAAVWGPTLAMLDAPVERIVVTHMHPDHVGGAGDLARLTDAPVLQGREDFAQCVRAWGPDRDPNRFAAHWRAHGMPENEIGDVIGETAKLAAAVHYAPEPELVDAGDEVDGWRIEVLPGHADGHIVLHRDGVLLAGDAILDEITPAIGLYPDSRPDPLGDYLNTLGRIEELAPRVAYAGHGGTISAPAARARAIRDHHRERLDLATGALGSRPRTAYDVSLELFRPDLPPVERRFAVGEALAHLEHLVVEGRAERADGGYVAAA